MVEMSNSARTAGRQWIFKLGERFLCMGKFALTVIMLLPLAQAMQVEMGYVDIPDGSIQNKVISGFPYGGMNGNAKLKISSAEWAPESLWLVPENFSSSQFKYVEQMSLPSSLNLTGNCKTSLYYNATNDVYAYKSTIQSNGDYCMAAVEGRYGIVAEY